MHAIKYPSLTSPALYVCKRPLASEAIRNERIALDQIG